MKTLILGLAAAAATTLAAGAALAAPYGYNPGYSSYSYVQPRYVAPSYGYSYGYSRGIVASRDSDRDGIPDRAEWNQDRDHDGRLDQYDSRFDRNDRYARDRYARDHRRDRDRYDNYDSYRSYYR